MNEEVIISLRETNLDTIGLLKNQEFRREFVNLPNILVQDPARNCAYYIPAQELNEFRLNSDELLKIKASTVTFVIPGKEIIDEIPPFANSPEIAPSVLIQYNQEKALFFMEFEDLQRFHIEQPKGHMFDNCVSFIIPKGMELIEELPAMRRGLLQSNTSL